MKKPLTTHRAAALERQSWLQKLRRELKSATEPYEIHRLRKLLSWGHCRVQRFTKKKGGL